MATTEQLLNEAKRMLENTEDLIRATAGDVGEKASTARDRAATKVRALKRRVADLEEDLERQARRAARNVDYYAHDHPWQIAAVGALAGLVIGILLTRRD